jgi:hypothetical protein
MSITQHMGLATQQVNGEAKQMTSADSRLQTVELRSIKSNPHRQLGSYPPDRRKVEALKRSIEQVGFWEGVIVRPAPNGEGYECAFGHHRLMAAREQLKDGDHAKIKVIVRDLDDGEMLQFMGRENAEDQRGNFLVMMETWESALRHLSTQQESPPTAMEIAAFLGWTIKLSEGAQRSGLEQLSATGYACSSAHQLIDAGKLSRKDFDGLSVGDARELARTVNRQLSVIDKTSGDPTQPPALVEQKRTAVIDAAKAVAHNIKAGTRHPGRSGSIRAEIIDRAFKPKRIPDFAHAMRSMSDRAQGWHASDYAAKIDDICAVFDQVDRDDIQLYRFLKKDLEGVVARCRESINKINRHLTTTAAPRLPRQPHQRTENDDESAFGA